MIGEARWLPLCLFMIDPCVGPGKRWWGALDMWPFLTGTERSCGLASFMLVGCRAAAGPVGEKATWAGHGLLRGGQGGLVRTADLTSHVRGQ